MFALALPLLLATATLGSPTATIIPMDPDDAKFSTPAHLPQHWMLVSLANGTVIPGLTEWYARKAGSKSPFIVDGETATAGKQPWMVSIQAVVEGKAYHICGGSLMEPNKVLTAGHCLVNDYNYQFAFGYYKLSLGLQNPGSQIIKMLRKVDAGYKEGGAYPNDIAVVTLEKAADITSAVKVIVTAYNPPADFDGAKMSLTGWGDTEGGGTTPDTLRFGWFTGISESKCKEQWGDNILSQHLCTSGTPTTFCQGDSGGPLVYWDDDGTPYQTGVVSWLIKGCYIGYPAVFQSPGAHVAFLDKYRYD